MSLLLILESLILILIILESWILNLDLDSWNLFDSGFFGIVKIILEGIASTKPSDLKNYVGLNSSSNLRIHRCKGNTLVDPKKIKKHKKGKYIILKSRYAHSIKGCRLSYPNFIWGPLFGGMQPSIDRLEVLNTHY